jgi:hypothetical protein
LSSFLLSVALDLTTCPVTSAAADASEKKFSLKTLQSGITALSADLKANAIYDSRVITVSNQIIRLHNEMTATGKKPTATAEIKAELKKLSELLPKLDTSKLAVYAKKGEPKKTDKTAIAETQARLDKVKANVAKASKALG